MAVRLVRRTGGPFDRETLRGPFYAQCYATTMFTLALSVGSALAQSSLPALRLPGALLIVGGFIYSIVTETRWFAMKLGVGWPPALPAASFGLLGGFLFLALVGFLLSR